MRRKAHEICILHFTRKMHLRVKEREPGNEVAILNTVFKVKNWARSCYVTGKNLDLASARFRIHSVFKNFHSGERIQKVADSYAGFTGYVWTEVSSGKKKLGIQ